MTVYLPEKYGVFMGKDATTALATFYLSDEIRDGYDDIKALKKHFYVNISHIYTETCELFQILAKTVQLLRETWFVHG